MIFVGYMKCSTCRNARKWLDEREIPYTFRDIKEDHPAAFELMEWHRKSGLPIRKFVNTSGLLYREMKLKDRLPQMSEEEICELLGTDGMLVKRPILVAEDFVLTGFKESEWTEKF